VKRRKTLEVLARAVCPPDGLTDALIERTLDEMDELISTVGTPARALLRSVVGMLELSSVRPRYHWRPLSALDPSEVAEILAGTEQRRPPWWPALRLLRDVLVLCHYEQPELRATVGYDPDPWIAERSQSRTDTWAQEIESHKRLLLSPAPIRTPVKVSSVPPTGSIRPGAEMPGEELECDVVVVGSGAGGAVVAAELAEAGLEVVVLEEGHHHPTESFNTSTTQTLRRLYREGGATATVGKVPVQFFEGRCVGGSTVINGAMAFRAPERILSQWSQSSGFADLAESGLDEEYSRVERFLSVSQQDPGSAGRDQHLLRTGAEKLGWRVIDNTRAQVHCAGCNVCLWGCPTGAKQSTLVSYLPRATSYGAAVWSGCRVERVLLRGKRAVGVAGHVLGAAGDPGRPFRVRARKVVVSGGTVQTPLLLQRSGIRSPSGRLGHNLSVHPGGTVAAEFDEPVDGWKGAHQTVQVREFEDAGIVLAAVNLPPSLVAMLLPMNGASLGETMMGYNNIVTAGFLIEDRGNGQVRSVGPRGMPLATYRLDPRDAAKVVRGLSLLGEALFCAGARRVHVSVDGMPPLTDEGEARRLTSQAIDPTLLRLSTVHLMGTAAMGADPLASVCDRNGAVHDAADLFVADASLFPGPVGVNPMLTVMALATGVATRMIEEWQ
jgi:choline dehydrogenase-like flavoprotein